MKAFSARRRFAAALALYLAWVGALALLSVTSAKLPPDHPVNDGPARLVPSSAPEESP